MYVRQVHSQRVGVPRWKEDTAFGFSAFSPCSRGARSRLSLLVEPCVAMREYIDVIYVGSMQSSWPESSEEIPNKNDPIQRSFPSN